MNTRELILDMLMQILEEQKMSHYVMKDTFLKYPNLEKIDRAFISRITLGCVEHCITIDYDINRFSKVKVKKMKPLIRNIIRMGVYQMKYMTQIPDSAICNEAVKLAKKRGMSGLSGFVNGILRTMARNKDMLFQPLQTANEITNLSYQYSMPEWILTMWKESYPQKNLNTILEYFLQEKETTIRINLSKTNIDDVCSQLQQEKVNFQSAHLVKEALIIKDYESLEQLKGFQNGDYYVQDESSMLVGYAAGAKEGDYIIDVCAAPGGKALHLADLIKQSGMVEARDKTEQKVNLIRENIQRSQFKNIRTKVMDACSFDSLSEEKADVVIADLPCSGLGVIQKKPDIKYHITKDDINSLADLQKQILNQVCRYVKPGGILIYSTCTVNPTENIENAKYIQNNLGFSMDSLDPLLPKKLHSDTTKQGYLQLFPGEFQTDGFFIARFIKNLE